MGEILSELERTHNVSMVVLEERGFAEGGKVKKMGLSLRVDYSLSRESARNLVLHCSRAAVKELNTNKKLSRHLGQRLTCADIDLTIFTSRPKGVSNVSLVEGEIYYTEGRVETESWEEACALAGLDS